MDNLVRELSFMGISRLGSTRLLGPALKSISLAAIMPLCPATNLRIRPSNQEPILYSLLLPISPRPDGSSLIKINPFLKDRRLLKVIKVSKLQAAYFYKGDSLKYNSALYNTNADSRERYVSIFLL